ncbi:MAG: bifunctional 2-polyprenyl-6-hydroxyphenol methylase/3-demethylubiquinol 3-O-methyltransferase UbiG [Alphaproteobacteria bacterium]
MSNTVDQKEIQAFSKDAAHWWDVNGPFKPLHKLNPIRMGYIRNEICAHFGLDGSTLKPFGGLSILDIGCGGGLVCEPLARLNAKITGIDADPIAIEVAQAHAQEQNLNITYINGAAESLNQQFDVVLALEVIEHVVDRHEFVQLCAKLCKPNGLAIFSTLNRTPKSFALGIVAAEYLLRWVPAGTHQWKKFVKPSEIAKSCRISGLAPTRTKGLVYSPLNDEFKLSENDLAVNYFLTAKKV